MDRSRPALQRPSPRRAIAALLCAIAALFALTLSHARADGAPITLPDGTYRAVTPPNWDGKTKLPMVLYLHGYGQDSAFVLAQKDLVAAATSLGLLFVVPDGLQHGWSHVGAPRRLRDDLAFLHDVVADAERRWPVDKKRVFAAGFSIGGSMVWDLACHSATGFAAFLPVSGAFWLPYPERCESGPVTLRHTHGLTDDTVPMKGRTIFGTFTQGDVMKGWSILVATDSCAATPTRVTSEDDLKCQEWSGCGGTDHSLELCLHGDGHEIPPRFLHADLVWALKQVR